MCPAAMFYFLREDAFSLFSRPKESSKSPCFPDAGVAAVSRLNQDTSALRSPHERARTAGRLCVELHSKSGGVYTRAGGPSNARAQSESWRMPFTQAGEMSMEETVRVLRQSHLLSP